MAKSQAVQLGPIGSNSGPFGIPPGGPWFAFGLTGTIQRQSNPVFAAALVNAGWVGFPTKAKAQAYISTHPDPSRIVNSGVSNALGASGKAAVQFAWNDVLAKPILYGASALWGMLLIGIGTLLLVLAGIKIFSETTAGKKSISLAEGAAGVAAAPETGGLSLLLGADAARRQAKFSTAQQAAAQRSTQSAEAHQQRSRQSAEAHQQRMSERQGQGVRRSQLGNPADEEELRKRLAERASEVSRKVPPPTVIFHQRPRPPKG